VNVSEELNNSSDSSISYSENSEGSTATDSAANADTTTTAEAGSNSASTVVQGGSSSASTEVQSGSSSAASQSGSASSTGSTSTETASGSTSTAASNSVYNDGTYQGTGTGFRGGQTTVSVTVSNDKITDVTIVSHEDDRPFFNRCCDSVISQILSSQSSDVNAVSGATYSSNGIMSAVADALSSAAI
ncbi:MAG: FMN-binding protein, partial [Clostridia bacterium]|nr:FMN-binding protein [Clostridia bacterium]